MKLLLVCALFLFANFTYSVPVLEDFPDDDDDYECSELFGVQGCLEFDDITYIAYTIDIPDDQLEELLRKKLEWLMQFGLLKKIPLVGPIFHKFVEENQDLVRQALSSKIKGLLALANKLFERFSLG